MVFLPPEAGPQLSQLRPMLKPEPPSGGECPSCNRHNEIAARRCTSCGHWFLPPRRVQAARWLRRVILRR